MAKKLRKYEEHEEEVSQYPQTDVTTTPDDPMSDIMKGEELSNIRSKSIRSQIDTARTIAELEAWRADIDATLAVLRSQRK